ncbi:MAG: hypothetical protein AAGH90_01080 [Pseudomonadota bacterium]
MRLAALLAAIGLTACGPSSLEPQVEINPADFVLLPCGLAGDAPPCTLVVIGGKRLLFGAPSGISSGLMDEDLEQLDGVFLFSLRSADIEGLDEVRNASWHAGRDAPLPVTGPQGTGDLIAGVNFAFETADALRIVDAGIPKGGFDAAILVEMKTRDQMHDVVFDTGDVVIQAERRSDQAVRYIITYQNRPPLLIEPCRSEECSFADRAEWPLVRPHFIVKTEP